MSGDDKTLLAFDLGKSATKDLAGFTVQAAPPGVAPYDLLNELQFKTPTDHAQDATVPPNSSINAPIHKFRWLHFDARSSLKLLDPTLSLAIQVDVGPFSKKGLAVGSPAASRSRRHSFAISV